MPDQVHAAVLQFLLRNGYKETQDAFVREAGDKIDFDIVEDAPPVERLLGEQPTPDPVNQVANRLADIQLERTQELDDGDDDYYTTLIDTLSNIHETNILSVAVEPRTGMIATSSTDRTVKLTAQGNTERVYHHHQGPVLSIDFHPQTPHLMITTSMDGSSALVDTRKSEEDNGVLQRFNNHKKYVVRGLFSPIDGRFLATASYDRMISIYEQKEENGEYKLLKQLGPFIGNVETICFLPNENVLVAGVNGDNYLHYIHLDDQFRREKYNMNANDDDWVSFSPAWISPSPDGRHILVSTDHSTGRLILFAANQSTQVQNYYDIPSDNQFATRRHCWHPSGRYFYVSGGDDYCIRVIETKTGRLTAELEGGHTAMVRAMALDPQVGLVTGGFDHLVNVWAKPPAPMIR
ncbi:WD40-repeat-containing domain protein [Zychaea mexicana]|uniref:WD40-repeat-containing domain protein n=1 Tax=Zychaea mexicana TaxID=64656 RepID=UPI0022FE95CB|nr:WD40-repeat-containing domain protein [Zychaea mexicana]KAI9497578.1 WD40-repeat-containing domain protein [Zychaea mexicana]